MRVIEVTKKNLDLNEWVKRSATEKDYDTLIEEPCMLVEDGKIKIIYDQLGDSIDTKKVVQGLQRIKYATGKRSRGLVSTSRVFGYKPRNEMRQDFCSATSLASEAPNEHQLVCDLSVQLEEFYKKYNAEGYEGHKAEAEKKVKKSWRMAGGSSIFTSGIINKNNPLKYHFDTGNFSEVYSLMIVFKGGVEGGYLSVPEYGVAFKLPNNSIFMFDGQGILHGVTPIKMQSPMSYRFSFVYYSLKRMWQCLEVNEELLRIREKRTERERVRMEVPLTEAERQLKKDRMESLTGRKGHQ